MNNSIFIPKRINVGFQNREDTYTKKLAYIIYWDEKGKLRKERSWSSWRDDKIKPEEYDNIPTEGFVLNKNVGGHKSYWNFRQSYVRVYDPRGFEFEITIPNLLYILENTSSIKGKGLEGEFVYGWSNTELVLIPTSSPDYINLTEFTEKRFSDKKITAKDLKPGFKYRTKSNKEYVYMGQFDGYQHVYKFNGKQFLSSGLLVKYARENEMPLNDDHRFYERYSIYNSNNRRFTYEPGCIGKQYFFLEDGYSFFKMMKSVSGKFIEEVSTEPVSNYPELMEKLEHDTMFSPIDRSRDEIHTQDMQSCIDYLYKVCTYPGSSFGAKYLTVIDGKIEEYEVLQLNSKEADRWICRFTYNSSFGSSSEKMDRFFLFRKHPNFNHREMVPTTSEQIFKTLPPVYINQYLENGKFYRRLMTHE